MSTLARFVLSSPRAALSATYEEGVGKKRERGRSSKGFIHYMTYPPRCRGAPKTERGKGRRSFLRFCVRRLGGFRAAAQAPPPPSPPPSFQAVWCVWVYV